MSTLRVDTIENSSGGSAINVPGAAKAWVNFNGTGTVAIRASFNVSSITDNGTGDYTVNFTNELEDNSYVVMCGNVVAGSPSNNYVIGLRTSGISVANSTELKSTTQVRIKGASSAGGTLDILENSVSIFR